MLVIYAGDRTGKGRRDFQDRILGVKGLRGRGMGPPPYRMEGGALLCSVSAGSLGEAKWVDGDGV
jgi:hypothetical protein